MSNRKPHPEYNTPGADQAFGKLLNYEAALRDRQVYLQSQGYMLRPRLRPDWVPFWRKSPDAFIESEDGVVLPMWPHLVDATRFSDGTLVYLKRVQTGDEETVALAKMNSTGVKDDPQNHAVRILDYFQDDLDDSVTYIVMPFLHALDYPPMERVGECIDVPRFTGPDDQLVCVLMVAAMRILGFCMVLLKFIQCENVEPAGVGQLIGHIHEMFESVH